MNKFQLNVSFPLNVETMIEDTKKLEEIVGREAHSAGAGFAERDVSFDFPTRKLRSEAIVRVLSSETEYEIQTSTNDF
jgi:hypothetical protein